VDNVSARAKVICVEACVNTKATAHYRNRIEQVYRLLFLRNTRSATYFDKKNTAETRVSGVEVIHAVFTLYTVEEIDMSAMEVGQKLVEMVNGGRDSEI